jgi:tyrosine-protein phosphatase SIW14
MPQASGCIRMLVLFLMSSAVLHAQDQAEVHADSPTHRPHTIGQRHQVSGLPNFGEVSPTLLRGGQPSPDGLKALAKMGVKIVVDARGDRTDTEGKIAGEVGMQYVPIPWRCPFPNDDVFIKFLKVVRDNPDKKIFVHCRLGDDRTGMMVAAYRMADQGWSADEAMQEMQQFGFSTIHHLMCPGLASYEQAFPEHLRRNPAFQGLQSSSQAADH